MTSEPCLGQVMYNCSINVRGTIYWFSDVTRDLSSNSTSAAEPRTTRRTCANGNGQNAKHVHVNEDKYSLSFWTRTACCPKPLSSLANETGLGPQGGKVSISSFKLTFREWNGNFENRLDVILKIETWTIEIVALLLVLLTYTILASVLRNLYFDCAFNVSRTHFEKCSHL